MSEFPIDDLRDMAAEINATPDQHELTEAAQHQLEHHAHKAVEAAKSMAYVGRAAAKAVKSIGTAVHEALLQFLPEVDVNPVKGQVSGAPKIARKMSAREIRRANGDFQNAKGTWNPEVSLVGERYFDGRRPDTVLYPSTRAIKRVTAGRTR